MRNLYAYYILKNKYRVFGLLWAQENKSSNSDKDGFVTAAIEFGWVSAHSMIKQKMDVSEFTITIIALGWKLTPNDQYRPVIDVDLQQQYDVGLHWHSAESIGAAR